MIMKGYKCFETGADMKVLAKVSTKIREFNTCLNSNLSPDEASTVLDRLCQTMAAQVHWEAKLHVLQCLAFFKIPKFTETLAEAFLLTHKVVLPGPSFR